MLSRFFIDRPIFASVLSIVITLAGGIVLFTLPVTLYPDITPPTVEVSAAYPGANAQVVADTVAAPIEQQVNGVEDMLYMSSQCANDGSYTLTVAFRAGTDLNLAQVLVQNRVALAQPVMPDLVRRRGVTVKKKSPTVMMIINLYSPDNSRDSLYLSNYATIQLRDELSRLAGVGDVSFLGQRDYSMRVWLDPDRCAMRQVTADDVVHSIEQQNAQVAAGQIGQPPVPKGQTFQFTMTTLGRLMSTEQFGEIIIKTDEAGRAVRLKDVGRTELGAINYDQICSLDGQPSVALSIYQLPGSNALETARQVRAKLDEMQSRFPAGVSGSIVYDTTPFIQESVNEVFKALPRPGIVILGAWAAGRYLGPLVASWLAAHPRGAELAPWGTWLTVGAALVVGALLSGAVNYLLSKLFQGFNIVFNWLTNGYVLLVRGFLRVALLGIVAYVGLLFLTQKLFVETPTGFIPTQDKGYLLVNLRLPDASSLERTDRVVKQMERVAGKLDGVAHTLAIAGQSLLMQAAASNFGSMYVMLAPFPERLPKGLTAERIAQRLQEALWDEVDDGLIDVVGAPPIDGLGTAGGFRVMLEDRGDNGTRSLQQVSQRIIDESGKSGRLRGAFTSFRANATWLSVELDREAARRMNIELSEVFDTLQVSFGSLYVNDFNRFGRTWQVNIQADSTYRMREQDLKRLRVRSTRGDMVPLASIATFKEVEGPVLITRYNLYPTAAINVDVAEGESSGPGLAHFEALANSQLLPSMKLEWTELALLQQMAGNSGSKRLSYLNIWRSLNVTGRRGTRAASTNPKRYS